MFGNNDKINLLNLSKNWVFKYNSENWRIDNVNEYIWEEGDKTIEYEISSNQKKAFLEAEDDEGKLLLYFSEEIKATALNEKFETRSDYHEIIYLSERYDYDIEEEASFSSKTSVRGRGKVRCVSFEKKKKFVTVEYWDDDTIEYFAGTKIKKNAISNIKAPHLI